MGREFYFAEEWPIRKCLISGKKAVAEAASSNLYEGPIIGRVGIELDTLADQQGVTLVRIVGHARLLKQ